MSQILNHHLHFVVKFIFIFIYKKNVLHSILFADDQVICAQQKEDIENMMKKLNSRIRNIGHKT